MFCQENVICLRLAYSWNSNNFFNFKSTAENVDVFFAFVKNISEDRFIVHWIAASNKEEKDNGFIKKIIEKVKLVDSITPIKKKDGDKENFRKIST